jgi:glycosyltransferase involved in cell wall biosynthesis
MPPSILFLVPNPVGTIPGQRFRLEQYLSNLAEKNFKYRVRSFVSLRFHAFLYKKGHFLGKCLYSLLGFVSRIFDVLRALNFDLVYIYREVTPLGPEIFEIILFYLKRPIIYDFDDAIYLPSGSEANKLVRFLKFPGKTQKIIRLSTLVLAGNSNLKKYALQFNSQVEVLPTVIDTDLYRLAAKEAGKNICVGWSGSFTTIAHLNLLKGVLREIYRKYRVDIKVIGSKDFNIEGVRIEAKDWNLTSEIDDLSRFDIGLMPLPDDEWGRGKCALKALQYMALGIAPVCSPVGVNREIIQDGINGFLCASEAEWIEKISLLINNHKLRHDMGQAARKTVEERYSVKINAPKFLEILEKVYRQRSGN